MMSIGCRKKCGLAAALMLVLSCAGLSLQADNLTAHFISRSIPVFEVGRSGQIVIVKFRYEKMEDLNANKMESHQTAVLLKIAADFPRSAKIRLEYYTGDEIIISSEYETSSVLRFSQGNINKSNLLADASIDMQRSREILYSSERLPDTSGEDNFAGTGKQGGPDEAAGGGKSISPNVVPFLGAQYRRHHPSGVRIVNILDDSPAQFAGLRVGDAILGIENEVIEANRLPPEKVPDFIRSLPTDKPLRFQIDRQGKRFEVYIKLKAQNKGQIEKRLQEERIRFENLIEEAKGNLSRRDYDRAIDNFQAVREIFPLKAYQGLGIAYYYKQYYDDAFYYMVKAFPLKKESALTLFYLSVIFDRWAKRDEAILCFEAYLKQDDDDPKRRKFARSRLDYLLDRFGKNSYFPFHSVEEVIAHFLEEEQ